MRLENLLKDINCVNIHTDDDDEMGERRKLYVKRDFLMR